MGLLDWMERSKPVKGVQAVKVVQVNQPAPVRSVERRCCRWCGRLWPLAEVSTMGLCPACQKVQDNLDRSLDRMSRHS